MVDNIYIIKNIPENVINILDVDFVEFVIQYNLQVFESQSGERYVMYNGFMIKSVDYSKF